MRGSAERQLTATEFLCGHPHFSSDTNVRVPHLDQWSILHSYPTKILHCLHFSSNQGVRIRGDLLKRIFAQSLSQGCLRRAALCCTCRKNLHV